MNLQYSHLGEACSTLFAIYPADAPELLIRADFPETRYGGPGCVLTEQLHIRRTRTRTLATMFIGYDV